VRIDSWVQHGVSRFQRLQGEYHHRFFFLIVRPYSFMIKYRNTSKSMEIKGMILGDWTFLVIEFISAEMSGPVVFMDGLIDDIYRIN
jgi:hypothetical protein